MLLVGSVVLLARFVGGWWPLLVCSWLVGFPEGIVRFWGVCRHCGIYIGNVS